METSKILIIEDNPDNVNIISLFLEGNDYEIFVASNGEKGIQRAALIIPDLILLDILMPGIDGYETCRRLKKEASLKNIPVIFLSALSETFDKVEAFSCGGVDYITKPLQADELLARVHTHLSINKLQKKLINSNRNLEEIVNERTKELIEANNELIDAKEKAEESNKLKTAFLQSISHEVRTPLNGILGFTELLCNLAGTNEKMDFYMKYIKSSTVQLMKIIEDILMVAKIEANQLEMRFSPTNIDALLEEVFNETVGEATGNGLKMTLDLENSAGFTSELDVSFLKQIMCKLVDNAIKFTPAGSVSFGYRKNNENINFFVKDTGVGMDARDFELIFSTFRQLDFSENRMYGGTGVGLTISKALIEFMGGKIWLESELGIGTTIHFSIPNIQPEIEHKKIWSEIQKLDLSGKAFLVVDDFESNYQLLYERLTLLNASIYYAKNGREAVEVYQDNQEIDLILMDLNMPELNGYEATKEIRAINKKVPIIAFTAYGIDLVKKTEHGVEFNDYLTKPIDFKHLARIITHHLTFTEN